MLTVVRVSTAIPADVPTVGALSRFVAPYFNGDPSLAQELSGLFVESSFAAWSAVLALADNLSEARGHLAPKLPAIMAHPDVIDSDDAPMHYTLKTLAEAVKLSPTVRGPFLGGEFAKLIWHTPEEDQDAMIGVLDTLSNLMAFTWSAHLNTRLTSHVVPHAPDAQCSLNHALRDAFGPANEPDPTQDPLPLRVVPEEDITTPAGEEEGKEASADGDAESVREPDLAAV